MKAAAIMAIVVFKTMIGATTNGARMLESENFGLLKAHSD